MWSGIAIAGIDNRNLFPIGEVEVLLGGTGVAGGASTGAVYYNPARLVRLEEARISVSGTTYLYSQISSPNFAHVDNTDLSYKASGFDSIPSTVVSTFRWGDWTLATAVLVPESFNVENRLTWPTPNTKTTIIQVVNESNLWIGLSGARPVTSDLSLGISVFVVQHKEYTTQSVLTVVPATPNLASVSDAALESAHYGLTATVGALYRVSDTLDLGLRLQLPFLRVTSSGDGYVFTQMNNNGSTSVSEKEEASIAAQYQLPLDVSLGSGVHLGGGWTVLADISCQTGISYDRYPGSAFSSINRARATLRYNLGVEEVISPNLVLASGALYNPSSLGPLSNPGDSRQDYLGVTAGMRVGFSRVRTGLGLFYLWSSGSVIPIGTGSISSFSTKHLGGTLTFTYLL